MNGKKYPKAEKLNQIAERLGVSYDYLVSQKLDQRRHYLARVLESEALKKFPFHLFGMRAHDVVQLIPDAPQEGSALIRALVQTARSYDLRIEDFFHTALRCYQEMHHNYFEEIEQEVERYRKKSKWKEDENFSASMLYEALSKQFNFEIDETGLEKSKSLASVRSIWLPGKPDRLLINSQFNEKQKAFLAAREIGYRVLGLKERGHCSPDIEVESFEQVLNAFKASYFASSLFMSGERLYADLKSFFQNKTWQPEAFLKLMKGYFATSESFFYRLSEIMPHYFDVKQLHFLRFDKSLQDSHYTLTKQLNMSEVPIPTGLDLNEHFCRRWLSVKNIRDLSLGKETKEQRVVCDAQRSRFISGTQSFFCICVARPLVLPKNSLSSVTIGFRINGNLRKHIAFIDDPALSEEEIGETCERCRLLPEECSQRAADPRIFRKEQKISQQREELQQLLSS